MLKQISRAIHTTIIYGARSTYLQAHPASHESVMPPRFHTACISQIAALFTHILPCVIVISRSKYIYIYMRRLLLYCAYFSGSRCFQFLRTFRDFGQFLRLIWSPLPRTTVSNVTREEREKIRFLERHTRVSVKETD